MSKALLILDMPDSCGTCCLARIVNGNRVMCSVDRMSSRDMTEAMENKPDWCPLRHMPEKKHLNGDVHNAHSMAQEIAMASWNACIDAIGGGDYD